MSSDLPDDDRLKKIRDQIEFYLSDANISKNRHIREILESGCWSISIPEMINDFNRMKELKATMDDVKKALETSSKVKVIDSTISRVEKYTEKNQEEVDSCTIYVEGCNREIRKAMSLETVKECFSKIGPVVYVSLPKYKSTQEINCCHQRGFAFVEFSNTNATLDALGRMKINGPAKGIFPRGNKQYCAMKRKLHVKNDDDGIDSDIFEKSIPYRGLLKEEWVKRRKDFYDQQRGKFNEMKKTFEAKSPKPTRIVFEDSD
ncbi:hypothetical protein ACOME3_001045 [Neoechinorhynchus agilis]